MAFPQSHSVCRHRPASPPVPGKKVDEVLTSGTHKRAHANMGGTQAHTANQPKLPPNPQDKPFRSGGRQNVNRCQRTVSDGGARRHARHVPTSSDCFQHICTYQPIIRQLERQPTACQCHHPSNMLLVRAVRGCVTQSLCWTAKAMQGRQERRRESDW